MEETKKTTMKEKMSNAKTKVKDFVHDHKKGLIKGGIIAGAVAAIGGTVAAVVNRCGLPSDIFEDDSVEIIDFDGGFAVIDSDTDVDEVETEETTEE